MILDDFFIRALIAGIGVAIVSGPLGCFVIWRRLAYFGDTLSHSALLGVALAFAFDACFAFAPVVAVPPLGHCLKLCPCLCRDRL